MRSGAKVRRIFSMDDFALLRSLRLVMNNKDYTMKTRDKLTLGLLMMCSSVFAQQYQISGYLDEVKTDTLIVMVQAEDFMRTERMDTLALDNGNFGFNVSADGMRLVTLFAKPEAGGKLSGEQISCVAIPGEYMVINGTFKHYTVTGSKFFQDLNEVRPELDKASHELEALRNKAMERMQAGADKDSLNTWYQQEAKMITDRMGEVVWEYIQAHPDNNVSAYLLTALGQARMKEGIALLSDNVKNGVMAPYIRTLAGMIVSEEQRAAAAGKIREGVEAPDFTLNDLNGKPLTLSSLRGKYVVLDFWGSWCGWCIKGFPEMKEAYAQYKGKVEFLGISCRDTEKRWKAAVAKHQLPWLNVLNEGDVDVSALYAVEGYPTKIVINPEGKIQKIVVGESPEFYTYLDNLFK